MQTCRTDRGVGFRELRESSPERQEGRRWYQGRWVADTEGRVIYYIKRRETLGIDGSA